MGFVQLPLHFSNRKEKNIQPNQAFVIIISIFLFINNIELIVTESYPSTVFSTKELVQSDPTKYRYLKLVTMKDVVAVVWQ